MRPSYGVCHLIAVLVLVLSPAPVNAQALAPSEWKEAFRAHDINGDGMIDRAEFQAWMEDVFFHHDRGHKGFLRLEDVRGVMTPGAFKAANRKGDDKLTLKEFLNLTFQDFALIDTNGNGAISMEEVEVYIRRPRQ